MGSFVKSENDGDFDNRLDIKLPDLSKGKFLWRYIDFHKLLDFLQNNQLHFTRLDAFNDPFEGVKMSLLKDREVYIKKSFDNENIPQEQKEHLSHTKKVLEYLYPKEVEEYQKSQYVNCWYHGERESMAMWNLYSNLNSVAIKIEAEPFIKKIEILAEKFIEEHGNRIYFLSDTIKYLKLNPIDLTQPAHSSIYAGMKKDESYKHEEEYRFLISAAIDWVIPENILNFKLPLGLDDLQVEIICHPLMEDWKFENVKMLVNRLQPNYKVEKSKIEVKK